MKMKDDEKRKFKQNTNRGTAIHSFGVCRTGKKIQSKHLPKIKRPYQKPLIQQTNCNHLQKPVFRRTDGRDSHTYFRIKSNRQ